MFDRLSQAIRAISLLLLFVPSAFSSATYTVTALTDLPGSLVVNSLNNNNQIAGSYYNGVNDAPFEATALTFTPEGIPTGLTSVDWAVINDNGILGGYGNTTGNASQAFIGSSLVPLSGNLDSWGYALNDSGQLTGLAKTAGEADEAAIMTTSGTSVQVSGEIFYGINGSGVATGYNVSEQAIYGTASGVTAIPFPTGFSQTFGDGINSAGAVCGYGLTAEGYQDFYFNGTTSVAVPLPNGETASSVSAGGCINNASQIVGSVTGASDAGFIWSPTAGTQLLNGLVPSNWTISEALYINNSGTILAEGNNGTYYGYVLLTPTPEPSTFWLTTVILLCPIVLRGRRLRRTRREHPTAA